MRAKVNPELRAGIDGVPPGDEGDFADTHATRALINGGVLLPIEELPPEPPARVRRPPVVGGSDVEALRARFDTSWEEREAFHRREVGGLRSELEAARGDLAIAQAAAAENLAQLTAARAELEAAKAKASKKTPPVEG